MDPARQRNIAKLVWSSDYYHLLLLQVGANNIARGSLDIIKRDYRALGAEVKGMGAQMVFRQS